MKEGFVVAILHPPAHLPPFSNHHFLSHHSHHLPQHITNRTFAIRDITLTTNKKRLSSLTQIRQSGDCSLANRERYDLVSKEEQRNHTGTDLRHCLLTCRAIHWALGRFIAPLPLGRKTSHSHLAAIVTDSCYQ